MSKVSPIRAIRYTGENLDEIQAWLPEGVTARRFVDLLLLSVEVISRTKYGMRGEVHKGQWLILQSDGRIRRVTDQVYRQTWRARLSHRTP